MLESAVARYASTSSFAGLGCEEVMVVIAQMECVSRRRASTTRSRTRVAYSEVRTGLYGRVWVQNISASDSKAMFSRCILARVRIVGCMNKRSRYDG